MGKYIQPNIPTAKVCTIEIEIIQKVFTKKNKKFKKFNI